MLKHTHKEDAWKAKPDATKYWTEGKKDLFACSYPLNFNENIVIDKFEDLCYNIRKGK